ncbi:MAG TPA: hypothetical protein ENJ56_06470 [Anaerolineae bacterium]|nr:hypothetical protein [Anaerolineae bacterium]
MKNRTFQKMTQWIGIATLTGFALYGLLSMIGVGVGDVSADETSTRTTTNPSIPATFNYTGILRETDGSLTNGTKNIRAAIYNQATAGDVQFVEDFPSVNVRDGQFSIVLGDNPGFGDLLTAFETAPLFVAISLDGGSTYQTPRQRVHGVPWAISATNATNAFDGVPVGGIVDWWRPVNDNALFPVPDGFLVCNGQTVSDANSPLDGYALPNLHNQFTLGTANLNDSGLTGGAWQHTHTMNSAGNHNHQWFDFDANKDMWSFNSSGGWVGVFSWGDGEDTGGSGQYSIKFGNPGANGIQLYTNNQGSHSHTINPGENAPPWTALIKLCRIY